MPAPDGIPTPCRSPLTHSCAARKRQRPGSSLALGELAGDAGGEAAVDQIDGLLPLSKHSQPSANGGGGTGSNGGGPAKRLAM